MTKMYIHNLVKLMLSPCPGGRTSRLQAANRSRLMQNDNGDLIRKYTAVVTEEGRSSRVHSEVADRGGTGVSQTRRVLESHPWKALALLIMLIAIVLSTGYFIRSAFLFEGTDDAQIDGYVIPLSARINGHVLEVPVIEGQLVHAGDVLVTIDPQDCEIAVRKAHA